MKMQDDTLAAADEARRLAGLGDYTAALDLAVGVVRAAPDADLLADMARWRRDGFATAPRPPGPATWPPVVPDPFPGETGIPCVTPAELNAELLGGAILHHGLLRVNGLVSPEKAAQLRAGIDRGMAARAAIGAGNPDADRGWFVPLDVPGVTFEREFAESCGSLWTADCPPMLFDLIDTYAQCGLLGHIARHMGERPALSVGKSTLRRVVLKATTDWHQDGAFLGRDTRAVNVWLALSPCGVDAPGIDIVARRVPYVLQTGSHGARFDWSVGAGLVDMLAEGGAPLELPSFAPGDALLFDHMMLHRTGVRPGMTQPRWAIESWFFAPTHYPTGQVPLLV